MRSNNQEYSFRCRTAYSKTLFMCLLTFFLYPYLYDYISS